MPEGHRWIIRVAAVVAGGLAALAAVQGRWLAALAFVVTGCAGVARSMEVVKSSGIRVWRGVLRLETIPWEDCAEFTIFDHAPGVGHLSRRSDGAGIFFSFGGCQPDEVAHWASRAGAAVVRDDTTVLHRRGLRTTEVLAGGLVLLGLAVLLRLLWNEFGLVGP
jgi:hypothetical protein